MSTGMLSMRTWSATGLTKSALLIHGNREVGDAWYKVAEGLVKEGEQGVLPHPSRTY